jgi:hypothetical protein
MTTINPNVSAPTTALPDAKSTSADATNSNVNGTNNTAKDSSNTQFGSTAKTPAQISADNHPPDKLSEWKNGGNLIASSIQASKANATPAKTIAQGKDLAPQVRENTVNQMTYEARLQAATKEVVTDKDKNGNLMPTYADQLNTAALNIAENPKALLEGTYKSLQNASYLTGKTGTNILGQTSSNNVLTPVNFDKAATNPLEVAKYSGSQDAAVEKVQGYTNKITTLQGEINSLSKELKNPTVKTGLGALDSVIDSTAGAANRSRIQTTIQAKEAEIKVIAFDRGEFINTARLQDSKGENGKTYQAVGKDANPNNVPVIFIPGVNTDKNRGAVQAMDLSNTLKAPVNQIVNTSSKDTMIRAGAGILTGKGSEALGGAALTGIGTAIVTKNPVAGIGVAKDSATKAVADPSRGDQQIQQHLTGNRPAAVATANQILKQMNDPAMIAAKTPIKIIGYSQGAAIGSQALREVNSTLQAQVDKGTLKSEAKQAMMDRVQFLGIGPGAADRHVRSEFVGGSVKPIKGLETVKYRTISDQGDNIAKLLGVKDNKAETGPAINAVTALAGKNGFHEHLSYFKSYEATDPGSTYNPKVTDEIKAWNNTKLDSPLLQSKTESDRQRNTKTTNVAPYEPK